MYSFNIDSLFQLTKNFRNTPKMDCQTKTTALQPRPVKDKRWGTWLLSPSNPTSVLHHISKSERDEPGQPLPPSSASSILPTTAQSRLQSKLHPRVRSYLTPLEVGQPAVHVLAGARGLPGRLHIQLHILLLDSWPGRSRQISFHPHGRAYRQL